MIVASTPRKLGQGCPQYLLRIRAGAGAGEKQGGVVFWQDTLRHYTG